MAYKNLILKPLNLVFLSTKGVVLHAFYILLST